MTFWNTFFEDGNINTVIAPPKEGKTNAVVEMTYRAIDHGYTVLSNIAFFKESSIAKAKEKGWLDKNTKYLPRPKKFKYLPLASQLLLEASKGEKNIIVIDEGGISISSSRALSDAVVQFKFLGYSIRKIGACLIIIAQSKGSIVPVLRKDLVDYEVNVIRRPDGRRDLEFLKSKRFFNRDKNDYDVVFRRYDYIYNVPATKLMYDHKHPGGFTWDIDLQEFYQMIALSGYDSIEVREHIPRIIGGLVAEKKLDIFLKKKKFMHIGTVAELFKVSDQTIRRWADAGKLNCIKTDKGTRMFSRSEVTKLAIKEGIFKP